MIGPNLAELLQHAAQRRARIAAAAVRQRAPIPRPHGVRGYGVKAASLAPIRVEQHFRLLGEECAKPHTVRDIIPDQRHLDLADIEGLPVEAETEAVRRSLLVFWRLQAEEPTKNKLVHLQIAVATAFKVPVKVMGDPIRTGGAIRVRHIAMALCCRLTTRGMPDIGRAFGGRDHTVVSHARTKFAAFIDRVLDGGN